MHAEENRTIINREEALYFADKEFKQYIRQLNEYHQSNPLNFSCFMRKIKQSRENNKPILKIYYQLKKEMKKIYDAYIYKSYRFEIRVYYNADKLIRSSEVNKKIQFDITIINYYFGRKKDITIINDHHIIIKRNLLGIGDYLTLDKRVLYKNDRYKIIDFLNAFPLSELKSEYINDQVRDGTQIKFIIKIQDMEKEITIANYLEKNLAELIAIIVPLLPEDYIMYNETYVS